MNRLNEIKFTIIHHSQRQIDSLDSIKQRHVQGRGWEDIGYHYLIENGTKLTTNGKLTKGRSEKYWGAHALGHNHNTLSVCIVGNFDEKPPTKEQINTLVEFLKQKIKQHNIPIQNILGHRELPNVTKTCPGKFFNMNLIRDMVLKKK